MILVVANFVRNLFRKVFPEALASDKDIEARVTKLTTDHGAQAALLADAILLIGYKYKSLTAKRLLIALIQQSTLGTEMLSSMKLNTLDDKVNAITFNTIGTFVDNQIDVLNEEYILITTPTNNQVH